MNLNQITVPVLKIDPAIDFYKILGLKLIVKSDHYARFECPNGNSTFSIHKVNELQEMAVKVYFEVKDLEKQVAELETQGIAFIHGAKMQPWLWKEARLNDPDGNHLILYHAGSHRRFPPWRI